MSQICSKQTLIHSKSAINDGHESFVYKRIDRDFVILLKLRARDNANGEKKRSDSEDSKNRNYLFCFRFMEKPKYELRIFGIPLLDNRGSRRTAFGFGDKLNVLP